MHWLADTAHKNKDLSAKLQKLTSRLSFNNATFVKLKTRELIELAKAIIDTKPPIEVPREIIKVLQDVIAGREQCAEFYATQAMNKDTDMAASNEMHGFFIDILKKIQSTLKCGAPDDEVEKSVKVPTDKSKKKSKKRSNPKTDEVQGLLESLELENNDESYAADQPDQTPEYILDDEKDDDAFAPWCFLADLNDIRAWVKTVWENFRDGKVSLMAAGMVTEMAFEIMQRAHDEFAKTNPRFSDWSVIGQWLRLKQIFNNNVLYTFCRDPNLSVRKPKA